MFLVDLLLVCFIDLSVDLQLVDNSLALGIKVIQLFLLRLMVVHLFSQNSLSFLQLCLVSFKLLLIGLILVLQLAEPVDHRVVMLCDSLYKLDLHEHIIEVLSAYQYIGIRTVSCDIERSESLLELVDACLDLRSLIADLDLAYADLLLQGTDLFIKLLDRLLESTDSLFNSFDLLVDSVLIFLFL